MNLNISSEQIANPLLVNLLRRLTSVLSGVGIKFFVIGATARDVILQACANTSAKRKTRDLDIAIAVNGWDKYDEIKHILTSNGFEKDDYYAQRFYFDGYEVDVVPFGAISGIDDNIYWPPDETVAMSVRGFDEVLSNAISVNIDEEFILCKHSTPLWVVSFET